jgi:hypothetical protein
LARLSILTCALLLLACGGPAPVVAPSTDTLEVHARAQDDEGLRRATLALKNKSREERVRGLAAMLEYDAVKLGPAVIDAVGERLAHGEGADEKAAAAWVLVHAGDARAAALALTLYGSGELQRVKRLDGTMAYDAVALARLLAVATLPPGPPQSAESRRKIIVSALPTADPKTRMLLVRALTEEGDDGALLASVAELLDPQKEFGVLEHLFRQLRSLGDPRAASTLAHYADHVKHPHFRTEAALRLAELGDLRAAPHLAWRLGEDPLKLYDSGDPNVVGLVRDDHERVSSARMLAELALVHPEAHAQLREMSEGPVMAWMRSHPQPHPDGLRLLVAVESTQALPMLRRLADPVAALPVAGAASVPEEFAVAQSALRFLGRTRDASAWAILAKQLGRKPASFDASGDALLQGKLVSLGMTYRTLAVGAAEGFWELGDPKAIPLLMKIAEDPKSNEQARIAACNAAAYLADPATRREIVGKLRAMASDRKREFQRSCWLIGLTQRPNAAIDAPLVSLLVTKTDPESRHETARLLGQGGLAEAERTRLVSMLKDRALVHDAALALLFGGTKSTVASVFQAYESSADADGPSPPPIEPLRQLYAQSAPTFTEDLYDSGALARIAGLALAARDVTLHGSKQEWVLQGLSYQLRQSGEVDAGPHSLTFVRLRAKLLADAKQADEKKRDDALLVLWLLGERSALASLGDIAKTWLAEPSP